MGGTSRGLSRRSFVGAGALGIGALALRPRRSIAGLLDVRSPAGLWGVARTDDGLLGLWSSGGRPVVVRLSDRGPVEVERILAEPVAAAVAIAAGGGPLVLGADEEVAAGAGAIRTDHLPASVRAVLVDEVDGPLAVVGTATDQVLARRPVARTLDGSEASIPLPAIAGGVAASVLRGEGSTWSVVQHPPTAEGDHCSSLTVTRDGAPVLEVADLGSAGPAGLAGPASSPLVSAAGGDGRTRAWVLADVPRELASPGAVDEVALHVADGRPVALLASDAGATLLGHGAAGWEVVRDVEGTAGARRVLAVAGTAPEFLVEVDGGVLRVDGEGRVG